MRDRETGKVLAKRCDHVVTGVWHVCIIEAKRGRFTRTQSSLFDRFKHLSQMNIIGHQHSHINTFNMSSAFCSIVFLHTGFLRIL